MSPRVEREGNRLAARWYTEGGVLVGDAGATFLIAGPFPYLWQPTEHTFYQVASEVDLDAALGMARVPSLPLGGDNEERVGRALLLRGRGLGVTLPAPEVFGLPPLVKPSFELRLSGTPLDVIGELSAVYSIGKVPVGAHRQDVDERDGRDVETEAEALARVHEAGFAATERGLMASEERAVLLWQDGLARLRASASPRFEVLVAESLANTKVGPPVELDLRVSAEVGWLDAELEFRAGALGVELARMHRALADSRRWIVLEGGTLAKISEDVAALVDEARSLDAGRGAMRLPPHQFGRIARWIELANRPDSRIAVEVDPRAESLRDRLRDLARSPRALVPSRLEATLRPYQLVGLAWLQLLKELGAGGLLADDMGLGKTLMTLAFLARWKEDGGAGPALVVAPTSVIGNWIREAERFTPGLRAIAWTGPASERREAALAGARPRRDDVRSPSSRGHDGSRRRASAASILDEAQNVKNPASATARAARRLDAEMRLALTGTPVENRLSELWSLMTFANPGVLGTAASFDERYERPIGMRPDGAVAAELRATVRPFILRRTKAEVLVDLPPKTEIDRVCVFGLRQRRAYDALALAVREAVRRAPERREGARTQLAVLTALLRLRQMACDPRLVDPRCPPGGQREAGELPRPRARARLGGAARARLLAVRRAAHALARGPRSREGRLRVPRRLHDRSRRRRRSLPERDGSALPDLAEGRRRRAEPHRGRHRHPLRSMVEPRGRGPGDRSRAPDRTEARGHGRTPRCSRDGRGQDRAPQAPEAELAAAIIGRDASALAGLEDEDIDALLGDVEGEIEDEADGDGSDAISDSAETRRETGRRRGGKERGRRVGPSFLPASRLGTRDPTRVPWPLARCTSLARSDVRYGFTRSGRCCPPRALRPSRSSGPVRARRRRGRPPADRTARVRSASSRSAGGTRG